MKNIKSAVIATLIVVAMLCALLWYQKSVVQPKRGIKIGILQTASHPALDAARDGFIKKIKQLLGDKVSLELRNAEGVVAHAYALAERMHADATMDGMVAIATPALQALAAVEKERPILIAAVTDPVALGVMHPATNVTGVHDMIDIDKTVEAMQVLVPNVKTVGLIYNLGELNSVIAAQKMEYSLQRVGMQVLHAAISTEADLHAMVISTLTKVDALWAPTDNTVASAMPMVAQLALDAKKPLIASHNPAVAEGALMARGVDYAQSGEQLADIAVRVLVKGVKPYKIPVAQTVSDRIVINKHALAVLGLQVPRTIEAVVDLI